MEPRTDLPHIPAPVPRSGSITIGRIEVEVHNVGRPAVTDRAAKPPATESTLDPRFLGRFFLRP